VVLSKALQIIDEVKMIVLKWEMFAQDAGVSPGSLKMIKTAIDRVAKKIYIL